MKICSKCRQPRAFSEFHKNSLMKDGYHNQCKKCRHESNIAHPRRRRTYDRNYNQTHRELLTAKNHYLWAHQSAGRCFPYYHEMEFALEWDTAKNTTQAASIFSHNAEQWMILHCPCPGKGWNLHVDKTPEHPFGYFGPGGIRWLRRTDIHQQIELAQAIQIVEKAGYRILQS